MYIIPKNVKTKFEFFSGFGWKELLITLVGLFIGFGVFLLLGLVIESIFRFVFVILFAAMGFFVSIEDPRTGKSLLGLIKDFKKYKSETQRYNYKFGEGRR